MVSFLFSQDTKVQLFYSFIISKMKKSNVMYVLFGMMVVGLGSWGVFAANNYLKPDGTPNFQELKSTKNGNKLTAEMWDNLMDWLSKVKNVTTPWMEIPAGAVMAFDLTACPSGWSRWTKADNRFLMGQVVNLEV